MITATEFRSLFHNGLVKQNTGLVQLLGLCPLLAISNNVINALSLGLATVLVMAASSGAVSGVRHFVPNEIRIPVFVLIIAALVTVIDLAINAFVHPLYLVLGIFIPLITTNCIVPLRGEQTYLDRFFTTGMTGYPGATHIPDRQPGQQKDFSALIAKAKTCQPPKELETGTITGGFNYRTVLGIADQVVEAVKSGAIKKFVVMAGCDGRMPKRKYFSEVAEKLPSDAVILTAGCAKYRYIKLPLGDINGIPRVLDAGQCNDSYSLAVIALKLKEAFGLDDVNKLPLAFDIAWYEQKAVAVLLALLYLGFKNIRLGPTLPGFLSPNVAKVIIDTFGLQPITDADADVAAIMA